MKSLSDLAVIDRSNRLGEFSQYCRFLMLARGQPGNAVPMAKGVAGPRVLELLEKAVVLPGGAGSAGSWGEALTASRLVLGSFTDSLRHASAFAAAMADGLLIKVPLNSTLGWVAAGAAPATEAAAADAVVVRQLDVSNASLNRRKIAALLVLTNEFLRESPSEAEATIARELRAGVANQVDAAFVAALLDGVTSYTSSGSPLTDAANLLSVVRPTPMSRPFWVAGVDAAIRLSTTHSAGQRHAPDAGPTGGSLLGIPLYVTDAGVAINDTLVLVDGAKVAAALGEVEVSYTGHADVESETAPAGSVVGSPATIDPLGVTARISLWQQDASGILARQFFGVSKLRSGAVAAVFMGGSPV